MRKIKCKSFDKITFTETQKEKNKKEVNTITETTQYKLLKANGIYILERKKDKATVTLLKENVEDYTMWGTKEFNKEANNTKF